ncbi:ATP-binding protein [Microbispora sp. NPDC049125]|uniref:ATP-binding protein n=1 Tax=Microbispora sp. NPDC049125 TaxID=3154929 RepID=UPI0034676538
MAEIQQWPITDDLAVLREHIQRYAVQAGLTGLRLDDLVIAANEAAINVLEHGGGVGTLAMWHDDTSLSVDVTDHAGVLRPEDVPKGRPSGKRDRGYGLWLMCRLCDSVSVDQAPGRSMIRLSVRLTAEIEPANGHDGASLHR